ncbi:Gephyrin [Camponotus floridanus]|uniref:Gephyrin n=1 Tax=Camponotus floridanus TaxID=104421 RepID=E2B1Z9_CAMFO|nr:Gephyrin [Camponotus floridanus]
MEIKYVKRLIKEEEENNEKINQATPSSSKETTIKETTISSSNNTDQAEKDEIKSHKKSYTDKEKKDMNKEKSPLAPGKMMEMVRSLYSWMLRVKSLLARNHLRLRHLKLRDIGSDIPKEKLTIHPYTRIGPAELGLLAATGRREVRVVKPVSIGILSIGDLLEELTEPLRSGYVYDSNRISLIALLKDQGFNSIVDFGIVTDDILPIKMKIKDALKQVVVLVTIGCSNDNDLLKPILKNDFDATIHFGNVFLKPGKSTTFATCMFDDKLKYLVCLPKNPVSTSVSAHLFLLPILKKLHRIGTPCQIPARIHDRYVLHSRPRAVWVTLKWNEEDNFATAFSRKNLDSDKSLSSQAANALLLLPPQTEDQKVMCESFVSAYPIK